MFEALESRRLFSVAVTETGPLQEDVTYPLNAEVVVAVNDGTADQAGCTNEPNANGVEHRNFHAQLRHLPVSPDPEPIVSYPCPVV